MSKLSNDALLIFGGDSVARVLGFLATIHLAAVLDQSHFGMIIIGTAVLSYALWFSDLGLTTLGTREVARPVESREFHLADFLTVRSVLAVIVFVAAQTIIGFIYHDPTLQWVVRLYLLSIFSYALFLEWYYQGTRRYGPVVLSKIVSGVVYLAGLYVAVGANVDVMLVPLYFLAGILASDVMLLLMRQGNDSILSRQPSLARYQKLWKRSSAIGTGGILAQGVQLLPPLAVGYFGSTAEAGVLGIALKITFLVLILDRVFVALFLPVVSELWARDRGQLEQMLAVLTRLVVTGAMSVGVLLAIFPEPVLRLFFDPLYRTAAQPLSILSGFVVLTIINTLFSYCLIAIGQERTYFRVSLISGLATIVLVPLMTWLWNLNGAVGAMVVSEGIMVGLMYHAFRKHFSVAFFAPLMLGSAIAAGLIAGMRLLEWHQLWQVPLVWIVFVVLAFLLHGFRREEIAYLRGKL